MTTEAEKPKKRARAAAPPAPKASNASPASGGQSETASNDARLFSSQRDMLSDVAGNTIRIVYRAASVLEEELNTGIGATRRLEEKLIDVEKLRSGDPQEVMQRFRRDAHDVVDILIDLVNVTTNAVDNLTQRMVTIQLDQSPSKGGAAASPGIPALSVPTPVKAGGEVQIPMMLENESNRQTETFNLLSSDLVNVEGERIAADQIAFTPKRMVLEPHKAATVTVIVHVPENTKPGLYSGLLQASRLEQLRAVLTIQIE
jgi:hypothetical protein